MDWSGKVGPGGDVTQRDRAEGRKRGQHLTPEEREELGLQAVLLHAEGRTFREIARAIGVHYNTVGGLIREEYGRRKATREEERSRAIAVYRKLQADGWDRLKVLPTGSAAQNVTGMHNAIRQEQERIDKITGIEAPTKSQHERRVTTVDVTKMPDEDAIAFAEIVGRNPEVFGPLMEAEPHEPW